MEVSGEIVGLSRLGQRHEGPCDGYPTFLHN